MVYMAATLVWLTLTMEPEGSTTRTMPASVENTDPRVPFGMVPMGPP